MIRSHRKWAEQTFGKCDLGDPRRNKRLIKMTANLANEPGKALVNITQSPADMEGAYRFLGNENIEARAIAEAGFQATVSNAKQYELLLALEDTTALVYKHRTIREDLGHVNKNTSTRGLLAHSILLFAPEQSQIVGLIEQTRWSRDITTIGKRHTRAKTQYEDKESYKWEVASKAMHERLQEQGSKVISVCDREADIYEYLLYKIIEKQRFIVRSKQNRKLTDQTNRLYEFADELESAGTKTIQIAQKGGRKARKAKLDITFAPITLQAPSHKEGQPLQLYYVGCSERDASESGLNWHLLTSEEVTTKEQAQTIISYYEYRWLIEEYHKVWKTDGTDIESARLQSKDNLERLATISSFIAARILQLKFAKEVAPNSSCEQILTPKAWKLLWLKRTKTKPPKQPPTAAWAYENLARLGGWKDTKRTGRASVKVLWQGWFKLQNIVEGYDLAKSLEADL